MIKFLELLGLPALVLVRLIGHLRKMENTQTKTKEEKNGFMTWLMEDDSPEIGIASKEPLGEYFKGVQTEFKKITWPDREQIKNEFFAVVVIVAAITVIVYGIDLGLDRIVSMIKG